MLNGATTQCCHSRAPALFSILSSGDLRRVAGPIACVRDHVRKASERTAFRSESAWARHRPRRRLCILRSKFVARLVHFADQRVAMLSEKPKQEINAMCDYSLHTVSNRPAQVGDKLILSCFPNTFTRGFSEVGKPSTAVCLQPGTEIAFDEPIRPSHGFLQQLIMFSQIGSTQIPDRLGRRYVDALPEWSFRQGTLSRRGGR